MAGSMASCPASTGSLPPGERKESHKEEVVAKLGTHKRPAVVRVRTAGRGEDIVSLCNQHGWQVIVGVEPDEPEDTSDLEKLLSAGVKTSKPRLPPRISGNDYCPCGSGKKYKKCCGAA